MTTGFPETVLLAFDPATDEGTAEVFRNDVARTLYLLWRFGHVVSQHFPCEVLLIADEIERRKPKTAADLKKCFPYHLQAYDFPPGDVAEFVEKAMPYFTGGATIGFRVEISK